MKELLRYATESHMAVFRNRERGSGCCGYIEKVAYAPPGIRFLSSEHTGWGWYGSRYIPAANMVVAYTSKRADGACALRLRYIRSDATPDYRKGLISNLPLLERMAHHYASVWGIGATSRAPFHGDLSLDNVIVTGKDVIVIDWEHFSQVEAPWGFDYLHLIFETLWFTPDRPGALGAAGFLIRRLSDQSPPGVDLPSRPLSAVTEFMRKNADHWGAAMDRNPPKFPVLSFSPREISAVDDALQGAIRRPEDRL